MIREGFTEEIWKEFIRNKTRKKNGKRSSIAKILYSKMHFIVLMHYVDIYLASLGTDSSTIKMLNWDRQHLKQKANVNFE